MKLRETPAGRAYIAARLRAYAIALRARGLARAATMIEQRARGLKGQRAQRLRVNVKASPKTRELPRLEAIR